MHKVWILECAAEEASEAAGWYESQQPGLGLKFQVTVNHAIDLIEENSGLMFPIADSTGEIYAHHLPLR